MITNLGFDLTSIGGTNPEYFASEAALETRIETLTGATWDYDGNTCQFTSNDNPTPVTFPSRFRVDFVDTNTDSTGYCNAGALDYTKFTKIDLSAYGGSVNTVVANATDIVNAFAALSPSRTVSVTGCQLEIINWGLSATPTNVEVNSPVVATLQDGSGNTLTCADL